MLSISLPLFYSLSLCLSPSLLLSLSLYLSPSLLLYLSPFSSHIISSFLSCSFLFSSFSCSLFYSLFPPPSFIFSSAIFSSLLFSSHYCPSRSVILGITQMIFGVCLKGINALYFRSYLDFFCEFLPMIIFAVGFFGYMVILIFVKVGHEMYYGLLFIK